MQPQGNGKFSISCVGACVCVCVEVVQTRVCSCFRLRLRCSCEPALWVILFCRCYKFYLLITVGRSFTSNNACKEWNRIIFYQREAVNILKIKTAADEGEFRGWRLIRMLGGGLIKMECPFKGRMTYLINDFSQLTITENYSQKAENSILRIPHMKISRGRMPVDPPRTLRLRRLGWTPPPVYLIQLRHCSLF